MPGTLLQILVILLIAFFYFRFRVLPQPGTRRLALAVWSAYSPHENADRAKDVFLRSCRIVFGEEETVKQKEWMETVTNRFYKWEAEGRFQSAERRTSLLYHLIAWGSVFDSALRQFREQLEAEVTKGVEWLNKDYLEEWGHRLEPIKQPDGTLQVAYRQTLPDEAIQEKKQKLAKDVYQSVGKNLLEDQSPESEELLSFLKSTYQEYSERKLETPESFGVAWFKCLEIEEKLPDSEFAQNFKRLNQAWTESRSDDSEEMEESVRDFRSRGAIEEIMEHSLVPGSPSGEPYTSIKPEAVLGEVPNLTMEEAFQTYLGMEHDPDNKRWVEIFKSKVSEKDKKVFIDGLKEIENEVNESRYPYKELRSKLMLYLWNLLLLQKIEEFDEETKRGISEKLLKKEYDQLKIAEEYGEASITAAVMRLYSALKFGDAAEEDWYTHYSRTINQILDQQVGTVVKDIQGDIDSIEAKLMMLNQQLSKKVRELCLNYPMRTPISKPEDFTSSD